MEKTNQQSNQNCEAVSRCRNVLKVGELAEVGLSAKILPKIFYLTVATSMSRVKESLLVLYIISLSQHGSSPALS